jgi:hypothetical protein
MIESLDVNETEARIFHVSHDKKRDRQSADSRGLSSTSFNEVDPKRL